MLMKCSTKMIISFRPKTPGLKLLINTEEIVDKLIIAHNAAVRGVGWESAHAPSTEFKKKKVLRKDLPQSPKIGPAPAARASLPSSVNPYAIVPVPAIRTHPWSSPIVPLARAATASFWTYNFTWLENISLFWIKEKTIQKPNISQSLVCERKIIIVKHYRQTKKKKKKKKKEN